MSSSRTYFALRKQQGWPAASLPNHAAGPYLNHARYDPFGNLGAENSTVAQSASCQTCYLTPDHLGSTRVVTGPTGQPVARHDYEPFGGEISFGTSSPRYGIAGYGAPDTDIDPRFTGQLRDFETNLDYFISRHHSSAEGRFTSPDEPLADQDPEDPQSWNLYSYARNNPLTYIDPTGRFIIALPPQEPPEPEDSSTWDEIRWRSLLLDAASTTAQMVQKTQESAQPFVDWMFRPRNPWCLAGAVGAGSTAGAVLGATGVWTIPFTVPAGFLGGGLYGGVAGLSACMSNSGPTSSSGPSGGSRPNRSWNYGGHKSGQKWQNQMTKRGWTEQQIDEAIAGGQRFAAPNNVNPGNGATGFVHPTTGRSVVIDNVTKELLHVGGTGFNY